MSPSSKAKKSAPRRPAPKKPTASKHPAKKSPPARKHRPLPKTKAKTETKPKPKATPVAPAKGKKAPSSPKAAAPPVPEVQPRVGDGRRHVLSLSFLRDGDEFLARMETDAGQITELKNRSLDQLLTLVAGELEDLLE